MSELHYFVLGISAAGEERDILCVNEVFKFVDKLLRLGKSLEPGGLSIVNYHFSPVSFILFIIFITCGKYLLHITDLFYGFLREQMIYYAYNCRAVNAAT